MNISGSDSSGLGDNLTHFTKEAPMPVFTKCEDVANISGENTESTMALVSVSRMRPQITPPMLQQIASLPPTRIVKILEVREQLVRGTYNIDQRLNAVLDHILADLKHGT
jgi:hypothetical protein